MRINLMKITNFKDIKQFTSDGSYQVNYPLDRMIKFIDDEVEEMGLQLNPIFQRGHVWSKEQQIAWLEYHLKGGKSGNTIYLNYPFWKTTKNPRPGDYADYVCVDGLQRITAAKRFVNNEIPVFGSYYREFGDSIRRCIPNMMTINVNDLKTEKDVLQWYVDMNAGGTPHSKEEIERVQNMIKQLDEQNEMDYDIEER